MASGASAPEAGEAVRASAGGPSPSQGGPPLQPTPLIGRTDDIETARRLILSERVRLVTLTGPAGVGKTRLGVAIAAALAPGFPDGVRFVDLAPIRDPLAVLPAVAAALQVRDTDEPPVAALCRALREQRLLVVLDNFEQVLAAAPSVADVLGSCPHLVVLATSRAALHLRWERELPVLPLAVPPLRHLPGLDDVARTPAVALFVARARAVRPGFALSEADAGVVAEVCARLDGLPLAIELAAARLRVLQPAALLARLDRRLQLLSGGARDLPTRHQTLRASLAWSFDLLTRDEQALFRRLGSFVGGFTLEAVDAVCAPPGERDAGPVDSLDIVSSLVANSLVRQQDGPDGVSRFSLLETVREFALDRLAASGEAAAVSGRHAAYYLALARRADDQLLGGASLPWLVRLDAEYDNLRAVLERSLAPTPGDAAGVPASARGAGAGPDAELALRLAAHLSRYWGSRYRFAEGRRWLAAALAAAPDAPADLRARAQLEAGRLAESQGDHSHALSAYEASLALYRAVGDRPGTAEALALAGAAHGRITGDYRRRAAMLEEALGLFRDLGDAQNTSWVASVLGRTLYDLGEVERAVALLEEGLSQSRTLGNARGESIALMALSNIARTTGDYRRAEILLEECEAVMSAVAGRAGLVLVQADRGLLAQAQGDQGRAAACFQESLVLAHANANDEHIAAAFFRLGTVARACGDPRRAARLFGAARARLDAAGLGTGTVFRGHHEPDAGALESLLEGSASVAEFETGRSWPIDAAIAEALEPFEPAAPPVSATSGPAPLAAADGAAAQLSVRERQVAALVAQGLTNREIATTLIVSPRTVDGHVASILNKLGLVARAQIAAWAVVHGVASPVP